MTTKARFNWIDWGKTIAIYCVVLGHLLPKESFANHFVYSFHLPFFFFISGYLFRVKDNTFKEFLHRILKSLIIPYISLYAISWIFLSPTWVITKHLPFKELFLFLTANGSGEPGSSWFLICLAFVWMMAWGLLHLNRKIQYCLLLLSVLIAYCFPWHPWWRFDVAFMVLPFFMIGNYFHCVPLPTNNRPKVVGGAIAFLAITLALTALCGKTNTYSRNFGNIPLLYYPLAFCGIGSVISFSMLFDSFRIKAIEIFSTGTIVIMGLHGIVFLYINTLTRHLFGILLGDYGSVGDIILALLVMLVLYYPIQWIHKYIPWAMGYRSIKK